MTKFNRVVKIIELMFDLGDEYDVDFKYCAYLMELTVSIVGEPDFVIDLKENCESELDEILERLRKF